MVSQRCIAVVKSELKKMGVHFVMVELGQVEISEGLSPEEFQHLKHTLQRSGLELMADRRALLVHEVIEAVHAMVQLNDEDARINFSSFISGTVNEDYGMLATLFSEVRGITLSQFVLEQKVQRVKQLLIHDKHSVTTIAHKMNYSSVAHLCNQFKKVTGLTPRAYKDLRSASIDPHVI